jgi:hypothetical protein
MILQTGKTRQKKVSPFILNHHYYFYGNVIK